MDIPYSNEHNTTRRRWPRWQLVIAGVILLAVLYYFRPWFQPFFIALYRNPFIIQSVVLGAIAGVTTWYVSGRKQHATTAFTAVAAAFFVLGGFLNAPFQGAAIASDLDQRVTDTDSLPNMSTEHPRILPKSVASQFAQNSLQEPRHRIGAADVAIAEDGRPTWSYPLRPDGDLNRFIVKQKGAAFVDMTTSSSNITMNDEAMAVGIGTQITDNIFWNLRKDKYFVSYQDPFVFDDNGLRIATPVVDYEYRFRFPIVFSIPVWDGVALTESDGSTSYVDAENVANHEVLQDQRTYPFDLARRYVSAMEYQNGILNKWLFHEDQLEVAPVPGLGNDQPFMMLTEDNPELFVATEPYGDASGLFEIWTVDAVTGDYERYALDRNQGLIGANKAVNFVRQANSRVSWASQGDSTGFTPIEPLPVVVDDTLYWQVRVVPVDGAGVAFTSFVNAESSTVFTAESDEEIISFLQGSEAPVANESDPQTTTPAGDDVTITIIEDDEVVEETTVNRSSYRITVE